MVAFTEDNDLQQAIQLGTFGAEEAGGLTGIFLPSLIMAFISYRILKKRHMLLKERHRTKIEYLIEDLTYIPGVSDIIAWRLVDQFPTSETIHEASVEELCDIPGVSTSLAKAIKEKAFIRMTKMRHNIK